MTATVSTPQYALRFAETMAIAAVGGALFDALHFPAGWLSGAMLFVAAAAIFGRPTFVPTMAARIFFVLLGIVVGGVATPETLRGMATWPASIACLTVAMAVSTAATAAYLHRVHRWEVQDAVFASVPGALSQVAVLAIERDADLRGIVIVQTMRALVLVVGMPAVLVLLGLGGPTQLPGSAIGMLDAPVQAALLLGGCIAAALIFYRLGFSGGFFFGPMVVSAILHGGGWISVGLPMWIVSISMVGLGAVNGARFANTELRLLLQYLIASLGALVVIVTVMGAFVVAATYLLALPAAGLIASYAPGAVDAMMILAIALHLDPVFVGAHHLARIVVVTVALALGERMIPPPVRHQHQESPVLEEAKEALED
jgi:membrane AbrB-like protein